MEPFEKIHPFHRSSRKIGQNNHETIRFHSDYETSRRDNVRSTNSFSLHCGQHRDDNRGLYLHNIAD